MKLTDIAIKHLKAPEKGQKDYRDEALPGLVCRVSQGGTRTFVLIHGRARTRTTLGRYPIIYLAQARQKAKEIVAEHTLGKHKAPTLTFEKAHALFLSTYTGRKNRTVKDTTRFLNTYFLPGLRHERLADITTHRLSQIIDRLLTKPTECFHAHAAARLFFRWATRRRYIAHSPMEGLPAPTKPGTRSRVLSDGELLKIITTATAERSTFNDILMLLLLLGQRRGEIAVLHSDMIDPEKKLVTLPAWLTKNKREHVFPFGDMAAPYLRGTGLLFPARGYTDRPFSGWSKSKAAFDKSSGVADYQLHDFRRSLRTRWAELGILREVSERYINHISGVHSGVSGIYDRFSYLDPMRDAVRRYERWLTSLLAQG